MDSRQIAIIGVGHLGSALASRLLHDPRNELFLCERGGVSIQHERVRGVFTDARECISAVTQSPRAVILFAVRPNDLPAVVEQVGPLLKNDPLLVSVAAGVRISRIRRALPESLRAHARIARAMPNLPSVIGRGVSGVFAKTGDEVEVRDLLGCIGSVIPVESEEMIDHLTGFSGSGPGFVVTLIQGFVSGGQKLGFTPEQSLKMATETILGTTELLVRSGKTPAEMLPQIVVPNGTTEAGIRCLTEGRVRERIEEALQAASTRAKEIADANEG